MSSRERGRAHPRAAAARAQAPSFGRAWDVVALIAAVTIAYANSFAGAFVFDDYPHIVDAPYLLARSYWLEIVRTSRPFVGLTLAVNHALGGLDPRGYHLVNLIVHVLAKVPLFQPSDSVPANRPG